MDEPIRLASLLEKLRQSSRGKAAKPFFTLNGANRAHLLAGVPKELLLGSARGVRLLSGTPPPSMPSTPDSMYSTHGHNPHGHGPAVHGPPTLSQSCIFHTLLLFASWVLLWVVLILLRKVRILLVQRQAPGRSGGLMGWWACARSPAAPAAPKRVSAHPPRTAATNARAGKGPARAVRPPGVRTTAGRAGATGGRAAPRAAATAAINTACGRQMTPRKGLNTGAAKSPTCRATRKRAAARRPRARRTPCTAR